MTNPIEVLKRALLAEQDKEALKHLRAHAAEVLAALDQEELRAKLDAIVDLRAVDPSWLAEVYEALAPVEVEAPAEEAFFARDEEDQDIGRAIGEVLLPGLPKPLRRLEQWVALAPDLDDPKRRVDALRMRPDVSAAPTFPEGALRKGVTPVTVFNAFEAIATLVDRAHHLGHLSTSTPLTLDCAERYLQAGPYPIRAEVVVTEISVMADCSPDLARGLCHWLIPVAWCVPTLFGRVRVRKVPLGVELFHMTETVPNLFERWRPVSDAAQLQGLKHVIDSCMPDHSRTGKPELVPV
jgi:hypothetical protein